MCIRDSIMLVRYRLRRDAGLIVPSTVMYVPAGEDTPVAPGATVTVTQEDQTASAPMPDAESETDRIYA